VIRLPSALRRSLAVAGAAFVGLAAAVALSSSASAHHPEVAGKYECVNGQWKVTWTVWNSEHDLEGKLTAVTYDPAHDAKVIKTGATLPKSVDGKLVEEQVLPLTATSADLTVKAEWYRGEHHIVATKSASVEFHGRCGKPEPSAVFESNCAGEVTVVLVNGANATRDAKFTVTATDFDETAVVAPGEESEPIIVPPDSGKITVTVGKKDKPVADYEWTEPEGGCEPELQTESTCEELIFTIVNPKNGLAFKATFTPSTGDAKTVEVAPDTTVPVKFAASAGLTVVVSVADRESEPIAWEEPEEGCGGGGGGELPRTGAPAGLVAGGAGAVLALGAGLFFLARRRRIRFTAA